MIRVLNFSLFGPVLIKVIDTFPWEKKTVNTASNRKLVDKGGGLDGLALSLLISFSYVLALVTQQ